MKKFLLLLFILAFAHIVFAQNDKIKAAEIKTIDAYTKKIDSFAKRNKTPQLVFADTSQTERAKWRKFASDKALDTFRKKTETYEIAYCWQQNGKLSNVNFTFFSQSGDWAKYVYLYFREDGTLAKAESELRTFHGSYIAEQQFYFDRAGKLLKKTSKLLDLETKKPKKIDKGDLSDNSYSMGLPNYYKTVGKLPFAHLLASKPRKK